MPMPPELRAMMLRHNQLGELLPDIDDITPDADPATLAQAEMVVAEMKKAFEEIMEYIARARLS